MKTDTFRLPRHNIFDGTAVWGATNEQQKPFGRIQHIIPHRNDPIDEHWINHNGVVNIHVVMVCSVLFLFRLYRLALVCFVTLHRSQYYNVNQCGIRVPA